MLELSQNSVDISTGDNAARTHNILFRENVYHPEYIQQFQDEFNDVWEQ